MTAALDAGDPKSPWTSGAINANTVGAVLTLLAAVGVVLKVPPQDVTQAVVTLAPFVLMLVSHVTAIIYRITATRTIGRKREARPPHAREPRPAPSSRQRDVIAENYWHGVEPTTERLDQLMRDPDFWQKGEPFDTGIVLEGLRKLYAAQEGRASATSVPAEG